MKKKQFIIEFCYYLILTLLIVSIIYIIVNYLLPVFFSLLLAITIHHIVLRLCALINIRNDFIIKLLCIFFYLIFFFLIFICLYLMLIYSYTLIHNMPIEITSIVHNIQNKLQVIDNTLLKNISNYIINCITSDGMGVISDFLISIIMIIPNIIFDFIYIVISSLLCLIDYQNIYNFVKGIDFIKKNLKNIILIENIIKNVFKAYGILFIITFVYLVFVFYFLGLNSFILIALLMAVFDFFPILGIDMIFIPWITYEYLMSNNHMALMLGIIYIILVIIRKVIEPKLLTKNSNISPFIMLSVVFISYQIVGVFGMIICPIALLIVYNLIKYRKT